MIKLEVEGYCQDCLDFTPDVTKPERLYPESPYDIPVNESGVLPEYIAMLTNKTMSDTIVQCKYRKRCAGITRYLERHMEEKASG